MVSAVTVQHKIKCYFQFAWKKVRILNRGAQQLDSNLNTNDTQINQKPLHWVILQAKKWLISNSELPLPGNCLRVIYRTKINTQKRNENIFRHQKTENCIAWLGIRWWYDCHLGYVCYKMTYSEICQLLNTYIFLYICIYAIIYI